MMERIAHYRELAAQFRQWATRAGTPPFLAACHRTVRAAFGSLGLTEPQRSRDIKRDNGAVWLFPDASYCGVCQPMGSPGYSTRFPARYEVRRPVPRADKGPVVPLARFRAHPIDTTPLLRTSHSRQRSRGSKSNTGV
jgi:hypothetical protein